MLSLSFIFSLFDQQNSRRFLNLHKRLISTDFLKKSPQFFSSSLSLSLFAYGVHSRGQSFHGLSPSEICPLLPARSLMIVPSISLGTLRSPPSLVMMAQDLLQGVDKASCTCCRRSPPLTSLAPEVGAQCSPSS